MSQQLPPPRFFPNEETASIRLLKLLRVRKNAEVWCGTDLEKGTLLAVKFLYPEFLHQEHFCALSRFLQHTNSPAIVKLLQTGTTVNGCPYIVMEYASKGSLRSRLKCTGRITFAQGAYLMRRMLEALCVLHSSKVVHRDIKPENVWIADDGSLRLGDFGIALFPDVPEPSGRVLGTARYCAPEQALDSSKADCRSDLYSLGVLLFEALTGTPFRKEDSFPAAALPQRCPCEILDDFSIPCLTGLIAEMLEFSPAARPPSPREVLERFDQMRLPEAAFTDQR